MATSVRCPACRTLHAPNARYCSRCGVPLAGAGGPALPGHAPHPHPLPCPAGFRPVERGQNLYFHWSAVGGAVPLVGTESLQVSVYNGGYDLRDVQLVIRGTDERGRRLLEVPREIVDWPRGGAVELEVPSYELPDPISQLQVEFVSAEFG